MNVVRPLPGPEIYQGIEQLGLSDDAQGWHSTHPIFAELIEKTKPETIIEVGSWKGASAIHMARTAPSAKIYCVDTWFGGIDHEVNQQLETSRIPRDRHGYPRLYHQFLHNVARSGYSDHIVPIVQTSFNGARLLKAHEIRAELIYVDASHELVECCYDLISYWPMVKPGGVMFGDDWKMAGVREAVEGFRNELGPDVSLSISSDNFWSFQKPFAAGGVRPQVASTETEETGG